MKDLKAQKLQCLNSLKPADIGIVLEDCLNTRLHGTCDWIIAEPAFQKWKKTTSTASHDRILCISGSPGCGKTILCSSLVDHLKPEGTVLFFPFSGSDRSRQDQGCLLHVLLWQSLQACEEKRGLEIVHDLVLTGSLSISQLLQALRDLIVLCKPPVYCFIDGVDECTDPTQNLLENLLNLLGASTKLYVAVFGRPFRLKPFIDAADCNMKIDFALVQNDIVVYTRARIRTSRF